jgi:hypothetical protein
MSAARHEKSSLPLWLKILITVFVCVGACFCLFVPLGAWECGRPLTLFEKFITSFKPHESAEGSC